MEGKSRIEVARELILRATQSLAYLREVTDEEIARGIEAALVLIDNAGEQLEAAEAM